MCLISLGSNTFRHAPLYYVEGGARGGAPPVVAVASPISPTSGKSPTAMRTELHASGTPLDEIDLTGRRWHVVVVKPLVQSGPVAVKALQVRGWQVLRPMCRELVLRNGQRAETERTLFGRYVFAGAATCHEAHALRFVPGVQHPVIDARRRPLVLRPDVLATVVTRLRVDGGIADLVPREQPPRFLPGQTVRVLEGPFAGFEGLFEGDESARVRVLLSLFGRPTVVKVPSAGVVAAE